MKRYFLTFFLISLHLRVLHFSLNYLWIFSTTLSFVIIVGLKPNAMATFWWIFFWGRVDSFLFSFFFLLNHRGGFHFEFVSGNNSLEDDSTANNKMLCMNISLWKLKNWIWIGTIWVGKVRFEGSQGDLKSLFLLSS